MMMLVIHNCKVYAESKQICVQRFSHASVAALWMDSKIEYETYTEVQEMALMLCRLTMQ